MRNSFTTNQWSYTVDGGAANNVSQSTSGSIVYEKTTHSGLSDANHTIVITCSSSGYFFLVGIVAKKGTSGIRFHNIGLSGVGTSSYASQAERVKWVSAIQPQLTTVCLDTNDFSAQTALATFNASYDRIIAEGVLSGDVLAIGCPLQSTTRAITMAQYHAEILTAANDNGGQMYDFITSWVSYANASAQGWNDDGTHPSTAGHAQMATEIQTYLGS